MLGRIRDILVRDPDPHLWLTDPAPDTYPDQTPDPTPFFSDYRDVKKKNSHNLPAGTIFSVLKIKFLAKILFCKHYFSPHNTFMWKRKDLEPNPYLWLIDPECPKTCSQMRFNEQIFCEKGILVPLSWDSIFFLPNTQEFLFQLKSSPSSKSVNLIFFPLATFVTPLPMYGTGTLVPSRWKPALWILKQSTEARNRLGIGCRTGRPEAVFLNVYGAQASIPRNEFRQPIFVGPK